MAADKTSIKGLVYAALFGALTAAGAFIIIPLPPVPITAQTFFLNVSAILLGGQLGAVSQFIYVMLGVVGIPVFAGGKDQQKIFRFQGNCRESPFFKVM